MLSFKRLAYSTSTFNEKQNTGLNKNPFYGYYLFFPTTVF